MEEIDIITNDATRLHFRLWRSTHSTDTCVFIVHGLGEHSGRYVELVERFLSRGYSVAAFDLRGHGKSQGRRGHVKDYSVLMDDISCALSHAEKLLAPKKTVLYGQSMGGNLVINYALRRLPQDDTAVDALVVTSPMLRTTYPPPRWKQWLGRLLYDRLPRVSLLNGISLKHLSRDPQVRKKVLTDRRCHPWLSARLGISLVDTGEWALENATNLDRPVLLMHGSDDGITSHDASREFADAAGGLCTFVSWPDARHELHHDIIREEVFDRVIAWLEQLVELKVAE